MALKSKAQELRKEIEALVNNLKSDKYCLAETYFQDANELLIKKAELEGFLLALDEFEKMISRMDTQLPDDDGIPNDIIAEDFKEELKQQLSSAREEIKK